MLQMGRFVGTKWVEVKKSTRSTRNKSGKAKDRWRTQALWNRKCSWTAAFPGETECVRVKRRLYAEPQKKRMELKRSCQERVKKRGTRRTGLDRRTLEQKKEKEKTVGAATLAKGVDA